MQLGRKMTLAVVFNGKHRVCTTHSEEVVMAPVMMTWGWDRVGAGEASATSYRIICKEGGKEVVGGGE